MSYPTIFRKRTIEYRQSGHTLKETSKAFKVSISAIEEWEKKLKERGNLENKALNRPHKKIDPEQLRAYVEENPCVFYSFNSHNKQKLQHDKKHVATNVIKIYRIDHNRNRELTTISADGAPFQLSQSQALANFAQATAA